MVKIYVRKILAGKMTIDDVPVHWRQKVAEALSALVSMVNSN